MKPLPILHLSSTDSSGATLYDAFVSNHEVDPIAIQTYSHMVKVPFQFLRNLVGKFATPY